MTIIEDLNSSIDQYRKECEDEMAALRPYFRRRDPVLVQPYTKEVELCSQIPGLREELDVIVAFVEGMKHEFYDGKFSVSKRHGNPRFARPAEQGGKRHSPGEHQECRWAASEAYKQGLPKKLLHIRAELVPRIAASYAYSIDREYFDFSFAVAWSDLCKIKAEASGDRVVTMSRQFGDLMSISSKVAEYMSLFDPSEI